jgi:hypothetical protein
MAPSLKVLAIQVEQIRSQIREMQHNARLVFEADTFDREACVGECLAIDLLLGSIGASFSNAMKAAATLTDADRAQAAEAGRRA